MGPASYFHLTHLIRVMTDCILTVVSNIASSQKSCIMTEWYNTPLRFWRLRQERSAAEVHTGCKDKRNVQEALSGEGSSFQLGLIDSSSQVFAVLQNHLVRF